MNIKNLIPPNPQHVVLKRIYPWDEYDITLVTQWLYEQAIHTGYTGTLDDFKNRYGTDLDNQTMYDGSYVVIPLPFVDQILRTEDKLLKQDVIIEKIPYYETTNNAGGYTAIIG